MFNYMILLLNIPVNHNYHRTLIIINIFENSNKKSSKFLVK